MMRSRALAAQLWEFAGRALKLNVIAKRFGCGLELSTRAGLYCKCVRTLVAKRKGRVNQKLFRQIM